MSNLDSEIDAILAQHNGELGVTWEDIDLVTTTTHQAITALIQQREVEARLLDLQYLYAIRTDDINVIAREVESLIKSLTPNKESL